MKEQYSERIELTFLMQDWEDAYNVGGLYRVADGLGIKTLYASGRTPMMPNPMIPVTSIGAHRRIDCRHVSGNPEAVKALKDAGWSIVVAEVAEGAQNYLEFKYPQKTCIVLGNEANGVYESVMRLRDAAVFIPMFGKGRSLNVHVAAAVIGYQALIGN
ncbi:MAG: tRNA methyltransferase [Armatimonadetes bacterium]|nr:tRNA methyltransferase [Armatimonadota bacterium]